MMKHLFDELCLRLKEVGDSRYAMTQMGDGQPEIESVEDPSGESWSRLHRIDDSFGMLVIRWHRPYSYAIQTQTKTKGWMENGLLHVECACHVWLAEGGETHCLRTFVVGPFLADGQLNVGGTDDGRHFSDLFTVEHLLLKLLMIARA